MSENILHLDFEGKPLSLTWRGRELQRRYHTAQTCELEFGSFSGARATVKFRRAAGGVWLVVGAHATAPWVTADASAMGGDAFALLDECRERLLAAAEAFR